MIKVVLFDLDDTLFPEEEYVKSGFHYVAKVVEKAYCCAQEKVYQQLWKEYQKSSSYVFNRVLEYFDISADAVPALVEAYRMHKPTIQYYDDVLPCLMELKAKDVCLGIITDGYASAQKNKLQALEADSYFDKIIVTDDLGKDYWKPHPKAFEMMKDYFDVDYSEMAYVGDNPKKDFYIGKIFPITTVRMMRDKGVYQESSYLENVKENVRITDMRELCSMF